MWVRRTLVRLAAEQVAVSSHVAGRLLPIRARVILHGAPPAAATPMPATGQIRFVYVGRLVEEKGVALMLDAAAILARENLRFEVAIVGDGPERRSLEQLAADLRIADRVRFAGVCAGDQLDREFAGASVIVLPSRWEEAAGLVILEAAARGRGVLVADTGGAPEYGARVSSPTFEANNVNALADAMRVLIVDRERLSALSTASRAKPAALGDAARMVREHLTLYGEVVAR